MLTETPSLSPERNILPENTAKADSMGENTKKKSSKRSLLTDITNLSNNALVKKQKQAEKKPASKVKSKLKPLPAGQKSITSFFRR